MVGVELGNWTETNKEPRLAWSSEHVESKKLATQYDGVSLPACFGKSTDRRIGKMLD